MNPTNVAPAARAAPENVPETMATPVLPFVEDFQLLSFALSHRLHPDTPDLIYVIVEPIRLIQSYSDFQTFNALALLLVFATLALASYVTAMVMHASKVPIATLRVLRLLFAIEMSALAIPIAQLLVSGLNCSTGTLPDFNVPCYGTAHLPLFIIDVIGILVFVPLVLIAALVFLDTSPTSSSPEAKPHGRIDAKIAAAKIILVSVSSLMPENNSGNWWYSVLILSGLLYLIHGITITQPYYDPRMTALRLGLITASATGMLSSMITYGIGFANAWLYVFIPSVIVGFAAGVALARLSAQYFFERSVRRWHHVMKQECHGAGGGAGSEAERLATAVATPEPTRPRRASLAVPDSNLPRRASAVRLVSSSVASGSCAAGPAAGSDMAIMARENVLTRLMEGTSLEVLNACKEKKTVHNERVFSSPLQVEACIRFIREDPTPKQISVGLQLLERGLIEFDDTLLLFIAATYLAAYFGDAGKTAADELIEQIKLRPIPFDEKFLIYARDRYEHESTKMGEAGTSGRGLLDNAEFQNLDRKSKKEHLLSLYTVREFYECVRSQGSLVQLSHIVGKLSVHRELANDAYSRLLVKFPRSKRLLRSYSQFLIAVEGNAIKAGQILEIAGDVEDSYDQDLQTDAPPPAAIDRDDPSFDASLREMSLREAPNLDQAPILGQALEPMGTTGAVVDSSRTTFPASRDPFLVPEKPMTKPDKPTEAPPAPSTRVTMRAPRQPMPYTTGSQTSGASMTKQQRLQLEHRRMLISRVTRPLQQGVPMSAIGLVYLAALSAGFVTCITYFAATQTVVTYNFYWAKLSRQYAMNLIDAIHRLLYTSWFARLPAYTTRMTADYATARSSLITNWGNLTANFLDTSPTSSSPEAKPHGRIDAKIAAAKIIFVFLGSLMSNSSSGNWWYSVLVLGGLLYLIHGITIAQPYYDPRMTALRLGLITASATGMLASMITYGIGFTNAWLYVFIPSAVTGFVAGVTLARLSARYFFERSIRRWHNVMKQERHGAGGGGSEAARPATAVETLEPARPRQASLAVPDAKLPRRASAVRLVSTSLYGGSGAAGSDMAIMARENVLTRLMEGTSLEVLNACKEKKPVHNERVFSSPLQVEACIRFIREDPTPKQISVGLQLLERGLIEFDDTLLLFIAATYLAAYFGDAGKTAADELIEQIKSCQIPFDEKFLIYARDRHEHESTKMGEAGTSGRGLLDNAEFQNLDRKSKKEHLLSLYTVREFYECVRSQGSLVQLSHIVGKLSVHRELANDAYSRLLVKFPKSKRLLRSYSQFLIAVEGNAIKAGQILEIAEDAGDVEDSYDQDLQTDAPPPAAIDRDDPSFDASLREASLREAPNIDQAPTLGPALEPMGTTGAVVDSPRTTFPASRYPFLVPEKPMTKPDKPTEAPPAPSTHVTMRAPRQPMPYTTGSQTSGASMTRQQRLQLEHRRMLISRVTRPLQQGMPMSAIGLVYLAALSAGFVTCITYFAATQTVVTYNFYWAKLSRQYAMNLIDAVHRLLYTSWFARLPDYTTRMTADYATARTGTLPDFNVPCYGTAHLPLFIIDVIGILVFVPLVLIDALVFLDTSPTSSSPEAKPHGRIDAKIAAAKIIFVFLSSLMPDNSSGNWWYSVLVLGGLLYLIYGITIAQPYYDQRMTVLRLGLITASATGMLASMITYGIGMSNAWLYVFIPSAVTGFVAGVTLARLSARYFFERSIRRWHNVMKQERHGAGGGGSEAARPATAVETLEPARPRQASLAVPDAKLPRRASAVRLVSTSLYGGSGAAGPGAPGSDMAIMARENVLTRLMEGTSLEVLNACKEKKPVHNERVFSSPLQVEACIRFIREDPTPKQISVGLQLLERGLIEFDDTLLLFIAATYLAAYFGDAGKTAADELIEQIKLRPIPFDEKFLIYARDRYEHESTKMGEAGTSGRGLLDNAEFQNLDRKSKKEHLLSLYTVREFYECVRSQGSLVQLSHIVGKLSVHRELANDAYSRLLVKFPRSKRLLRSYSQFLIAVEGNAIKAGQILEIAEDGDVEDSYDHDLQTDTPPLAAIDRDDPSFDASLREASLREAPNLDQAPILGPALEPMGTTGAVVDSSRTTFPASRDPFLVPEKPMTKPDKPTEAPPAPSTRVTMRAPREPMPYTTGSQTSGASMTKQQRMQLEHRRMLISRVTRPLQQGVPMSAIGLVYLAALSAGFVTCITYFAATQTVVTSNFYWAKLSRQYAMNMVDAVHRLLYTSWFARIPAYKTRMTADYATARSSLITNWGNLTANVIPFLANDQAATSASANLLYRAYTVVNSTFPDLYDYKPRTLTTLDVVQALATAGGVGLGYPTVGELTVNVVANAPSVRFIFDNFWTVLDALYALPQRGIDAFKTITQSNNVQSLAIMTVALVSLLALGLFIFVKPLKGYSDLESRILSLVRGMSKRSAVQIVTSVEEEIEAFKEVTDFGDADMSEFDAQQSRVMASGSDETRHTSSKKRLTRILVLAILALSGLTAGMFATAFQTVSATNMMTLMTKSIERRHNLQVTQLLIRQMVFPDSSLISGKDNVRYLRGVIDDFTSLHKAIVADPTGLSALLPQYTSYLPNATTSVTNAISNTATAGTTIALNPLIDSYLDLATQFLNLAAPACLLSSGTVDPVTVQTSAGPITVQLPSPLHPMWVQLQALTSTIRTQLTALDTTIGNLVLAQVQQATTACILVYAVALIGVIALAMGVHMVAFRRMRNKARTVIALLFLVPQPVLKEHADLAALIESGGMSLRGEGD
ncbi:hypothetical protein GGF32_003801 [Allomyces javanicus]|nr:hypothetical protein GGF32_003801 [Allomyces javanicus]